MQNQAKNLQLPSKRSGQNRFFWFDYAHQPIRFHSPTIHFQSVAERSRSYNSPLNARAKIDFFGSTTLTNRYGSTHQPIWFHSPTIHFQSVAERSRSYNSPLNALANIDFFGSTTLTNRYDYAHQPIRLRSPTDTVPLTSHTFPVGS